MAEFYSRADRERMAQGLDPLPQSTLTPDDYKDLMQFALDEAVANSPARDMISSASVGDLSGRYAGVTTANKDADGKSTGMYDVTVDWGSTMQAQAASERDGQAYVSQRLSTVFHEVHHVEQKAMMAGVLPVETKTDKEVVTQMTVNDLYPTAYRRGYGNTISEVDADVAGLEGALAFFDAHPELKDRYGFDFRKEIMRTDEYDVLEDTHQVTDATPEELLDGMRNYRDGVYDDPWLAEDANRVVPGQGMGTSETSFMAHLQEVHGVDWAQLEAMDNDERNVLLIQNAMETMDSPEYKVASNLRAYKDGVVMTSRYDEEIRNENNLIDLISQNGEIEIIEPSLEVEIIEPDASAGQAGLDTGLAGLSPSDLEYRSNSMVAGAAAGVGAVSGQMLGQVAMARKQAASMRGQEQQVPNNIRLDRARMAEMRLGTADIVSGGKSRQGGLDY